MLIQDKPIGGVGFFSVWCHCYSDKNLNSTTRQMSLKFSWSKCASWAVSSASFFAWLVALVLALCVGESVLVRVARTRSARIAFRGYLRVQERPSASKHEQVMHRLRYLMFSIPGRWVISEPIKCIEWDYCRGSSVELIRDHGARRRSSSAGSQKDSSLRHPTVCGTPVINHLRQTCHEQDRATTRAKTMG